MRRCRPGSLVGIKTLRMQAYTALLTKPRCLAHISAAINKLRAHSAVKALSAIRSVTPKKNDNKIDHLMSSGILQISFDGEKIMSFGLQIRKIWTKGFSDL